MSNLFKKIPLALGIGVLGLVCQTSKAQIYLNPVPNTGSTAQAQVAIDSVGNLYYGNDILFADQQYVFRYNRASGIKDTLARHQNRIAGLELGNKDSVLYYVHSHIIRAVNLTTGNSRVLFSGFQYPVVLRMRRKTGELYALENGGDNGRSPAIGKYDVRTGQRTLVAGGLSGTPNGYVNGVGDSVRFNFQIPNGPYKNGCALVFSLNEDTLYIGDAGNRCIRKLVLASGEVSTYAGPLPGPVQPAAFQDGYRSAARFASINGLAIDSSGFLYVADNGSFNRDTTTGNRIRKIAPGGRVYTLIGTGQGRGGGAFDNQDFTPGVGTAAKIGNIQDVVFSPKKDTLIILQTQRINRAFKRPSTLRFNNLQNRFVGSGDYLLQTLSNSRSPIQISSLALPANVTLTGNTVNVPTDAETGLAVLQAMQNADADSIYATTVVDSFRVVQSVSNKFKSSAQAFQLFPNPSGSGAFFLSMPADVESDFKLEINDILGRNVAFVSGNESGSVKSITMADKPGIYWVTIKRNNQAIEVKKMVIQ